MRTRSPQAIPAIEALTPEVLHALGDADRDDGLVRRSFGITVRAVDKEKRSVDVIASSETLDAYDEIVVQDWNLSRYARNPVVLWNHNRSSFLGGEPEDYLPIGFASDVKVSSGQLLATLNFVDASANPLAEMIWQGFQQGSIRAVSVGFDPKTITVEETNGEETVKLSNNELYEISVCPMGANPDAVAKSRDKAMRQIKSKLESRVKSAPTPASSSEAIATPTPATIAEQPKETTMTTEEQKALESKNAELAAKLELAVAGSTQLANDNKALAGLVKDAEKSLEAEKAKTAALNERCVTLETERAAQQKRANDLAAKSVERDLNELVGVKISPAEKPGLIKLSALDETLYTEQLLAIKSRPDMKLLGAPAIGADPNPPPSTVVGDSATTEDGKPVTGADFEADIQKTIAASN